MAKKWSSVDNSSLAGKAELRRRNISPESVVLDLFCGDGNMYTLAYKGIVKAYHGVDTAKIHDPTTCTIADNKTYVQMNDIAEYNTFDLDAYGSPWDLFYMILKRKIDVLYPLTFFMTDGIVLKMMMNGKPSKFVSALEQIPQVMKIPALSRWYVSIFETMLLDVQARFGFDVAKAEYFFNDRRTVCYWHIKLIKKSKINSD